MPRYKSISPFRHTIVISGKKYLISEDDVIDSPSPISYIFLQEVAKDTPVTVKDVYQGSRLQQQVSTIQKEKDTIAQSSASADEVTSLKQQLQAFISKYESDMQSLTSQVNEQLADIEKNELENKAADTKFKDDTNRRLGILKDAVRSMEDEVFGVVETPQPKN
jgi:hypothetical protein